MVEEAQFINKELPGNIIVKVPVTTEGIKAIKLLKEQGIRTLATTIYTPMSAYVAAKAGAEYVAPYVNRIDNLTGNGIQVVQDIVTIFKQHDLSTKVLGASFKNVQQMQQVCLTGAQGITAAPELIEAMLTIPSVEANVQQFKDEWLALYGEEATNLMMTKE